LRWPVRPPELEALNQDRKVRVSVEPEIKMGVLLGR
jgi:hypothetical protein